jgi:hypothetical protein
MPLIDRELPWPPIPSGTYRARGSASWRLSGADLPFTSWRQLPGNTPGPLMVGARQSSSVRQGPRPWLHYWLPRKRLVESSDYVDRDLHGRRRSSVLKPVCSVLILGPAHSRPILSNHPISMISDRSLKYVDHARPVFVIVNRAEDPSRLDRHHSHPKLPPCHALDFRAKVKR